MYKSVWFFVLYTQTGEKPVDPPPDPPPLKEFDLEVEGGRFVRWYWHTVTDDDIDKYSLERWKLGKTYYYSKETGEQTWVDPRVQDFLFYIFRKTYRSHTRGCTLHATSAAVSHHLLCSALPWLFLLISVSLGIYPSL